MLVHESEFIEWITYVTSKIANDNNLILETMTSAKLEKLLSDMGLTAEFLNHPLVTTNIEIYKLDVQILYFARCNNLAEFKQKISVLMEKYSTLKARVGSSAVLPKEIAPGLVRSIYLYGSPEILKIFQEYLPLPRAELFAGKPLPEVVAQAHRKQVQTIESYQQKRSLAQLNSSAVVMQKNWRAKLRARAEITRVTSIMAKFSLTKSDAIKILHDTNRPHMPNCSDKKLAVRIMALSEKVELFTKVKHWTENKYIENILSDCLYGRATLMNTYTPFRPSALSEVDVLDGDGNVISFGPYDIDNLALAQNPIELEFNFGKLASHNPTMFFKQLDFHMTFALDTSKVRLKDRELVLIWERRLAPGVTGLVVQLDGIATLGGILNSSLISGNTKQIHQILTLNFFKLLDASIENDPAVAEQIYALLATCTDAELLAFLQDVGNALVQQCEVNIYGAQKIDFASVESLSTFARSESGHMYRDYTLKLQDLIVFLNSGDLTMLNEAKTKLGEVFKSYRFLDYLISNTQSEPSLQALRAWRLECKAPEWVASGSRHKMFRHETHSSHEDSPQQIPRMELNL